MSILEEKLSGQMNAGVLVELCRRVKTSASPETDLILSALREMTDRSLPHIDFEVPQQGLAPEEIPCLEISSLLEQCDSLWLDTRPVPMHPDYPTPKYREVIEDSARKFLAEVSDYIYLRMLQKKAIQAESSDAL